MLTKSDLLAILAMLFVGVTSASNAFADSQSYVLNLANGGSYTPGYISVDVTRTDSSTATFTYSSLTVGGTTYLIIGNSASVAANINGGFTVDGGSSTGIFGSTPTFATTGSGNADGYGSYNLRGDIGSGSSTPATQVTFTVHRTSGAAWNTVADVLTPNNKNHLLAAHFVACTNGCTASSDIQGGTTLFASDGIQPNDPTVPEPSFYSAIAIGMAGLLLFKNRRKLIGQSNDVSE